MSIVTKKVFVDVSDEVYERVMGRIEEHNNKVGDNFKRCYFVGTTGRKRNFYTLWRHFETDIKNIVTNQPIVNDRFIKNLSTDFEKAVDSVLEMFNESSLPIYVYDTDNIKYEYDKRDFVMQVGKYKGEDITEVADKDIKYLMWYRDNIVPKNKIGERLRENIKTQIEVYFDRIRKHNQKTCMSDFVGSINEKITDYKVKVSNLLVTKNNDGMCKTVTFVDDFDNIIVTYINSTTTNYNLDFPIGKEFVIARATIANQYEKLGKKTTRINRVKFVA